MMQNRRSFVARLTGVLALLALPLFGGEAGWQSDWTAAFRAAGFDPATAGSSVFIACGDVHEPEYSQQFPAQIAEWNAMQPAPRFVVLLGDNGCSVSRSFGHTPDAKGLDRARTELGGLRAKLALLKKEIPLKLVIGNHDTMPGEVDAMFFRQVFPEQP